MTSDNLNDSRRPYGPPSNVIELLHRFRDRNLPARIDTGYLLAAGISENLVSRAKDGMLFLGLITEDGVPSEVLRRIATSTDEEYPRILEQQLRLSYSDVFDIVDPSKDDSTRVFNVFRRFVPASQRDRMVMFFLAFCREAAIDVLDAPRQRTSSVAPSGRGRAPHRQARRGLTPSPSSAKVADSLPKGQIATAVPAGLRLLLDLLPPEGQPLPDDRREQWLVMAREALRFAYPETSIAPSQHEEDESAE